VYATQRPVRLRDECDIADAATRANSGNFSHTSHAIPVAASLWEVPRRCFLAIGLQTSQRPVIEQ